MRDRAKVFAMRGAKKLLLVAMLWLRPVVRLPLGLVAYASLAVFAVTLFIPGATDLHGRVLMVTAA
ncbi:hypothetical protein AWV79_35625 [Cupriavidus sp. UYMMa02A]|nr:hypothetical protein AWV79_35625 [Cupriavidus sp. UYMMa02A]